jgi:hypothetical protein
MNWGRAGVACAVCVIGLLLVPDVAHADNCSSLSDCSFGIKLALALLAIVLAIALWYALGPLLANWLAQRALANVILNAVRANTMRHIFGKAAHNLAGLVARYGSERAVVAAVARAMARLPSGSFPASGVFEVVVRVGGQNVTVRGAVVDGIIRISTMFI